MIVSKIGCLEEHVIPHPVVTVSGLRKTMKSRNQMTSMKMVVDHAI